MLDYLKHDDDWFKFNHKKIPLADSYLKAKRDRKLKKKVKDNSVLHIKDWYIKR